ncbi:Uncharacterized protein BM_BM3277 [Brugia malayi]|uniref:Bm3277 n=1 Tax=Brugia malayi TaxID=6279 RepID=A0A0H5S4Z1_BRUMA|nr:Uncharacterized protein BM_BM3277 [Brugia malayi]CRZ23257.1 Bm3277 [Brugia malayi]VIO95109.1 Uncharacterized protein BM_BM3277 [Brugia malayi]
MLTRPRERLLLFLYFTSVISSLLLCYYSGIYCLYSKCLPSWLAKNRQRVQENGQLVEDGRSKMRIKNENDTASSYQIFELFVICTATFILLLSFIWLLANSIFKNAEIRQTYGRFEMPTAVICSLFAGICAVTEFHYSIDYSFLHWSDKWTFAGIDATALSFLHAIIAFALH